MERTDLNDIALFAATVQAGSLSRAAEQLCLPKSRLSRRLTALEESLGSKLMDRTRSGVRLNELGEGFYRHARMMLDCAEQAVGSVRQSLDAPQGVLRLSVSVEIQRALLEPYRFFCLRPLRQRGLPRRPSAAGNAGTSGATPAAAQIRRRRRAAAPRHRALSPTREKAGQRQRCLSPRAVGGGRGGHRAVAGFARAHRRTHARFAGMGDRSAAAARALLQEPRLCADGTQFY